MAEQLSLFSSAEAPGTGAVAAYASVVVDIPARALSDPFTYAVPAALADAIEVGATVLVSFGRRAALGYVVALACDLGELPGGAGLDSARIKPVRNILAARSCSPHAGAIARWMSREYVAPLAECLRLFLPPGATPRLVRGEDGSYRVQAPTVSEVRERVVSLTPEGRAYTPAANATRQRQLLDALSCGPVTTRELNALYTSMSATIRALEKRGVVAVEERRAWRGTEAGTTLSSARAAAPEHLTAGQQDALAAITDALEAHEADVILIDGVTGSGKTEVYLSAIERVLARGESACVLVPEISLTAQTVGRFRSRFGGAVAVFHSRLSAGERLDQWDLVRTGEARVVVGARSALFCPFDRLGIIIIDEEHEQSYKQGSSPRYHAREVACAMAREGGFPVVLGSATPSAEALERCRQGTVEGQRWRRVVMSERPGTAKLPRVQIADLRREFARGDRSIFSRPLREALLRVAERGEKAVLLHNRRGFAPFLMCRECGCVPTSRHSSTALTNNERTHTLECHTCGSVYHVRTYPNAAARCPQCGSPYLAKMGLGTQQVEDALRALLPDHVAVIRMDADSTRGKDGHQRLLEEFDAAPCAVLLGTQMIAKGLDFPEVTLAAVVMADYALKMPDFRASERAFDLLEQLAGRAGRGEDPGQVIIQTYLPHDPVIRAVAGHDRSIFTEHDARMRAEALYPPYVRLVNIVAWSRGETAALRYLEHLTQALRARIDDDPPHLDTREGSARVRGEGASGLGAGQASSSQSASRTLLAGVTVDVAGSKSEVSAMASSLVAPASPVLPSIASSIEGGAGHGAKSGGASVIILGPSPCVIERAKDQWRFNMVVKSPLGYHISEIIARALDEAPPPSGVRLSVDVDAYDLM